MVRGSGAVQGFMVSVLSALVFLLWLSYGETIFQAVVATGDPVVDILLKLGILLGLAFLMRILVGLLFWANNREVVRRAA